MKQAFSFCVLCSLAVSLMLSASRTAWADGWHSNVLTTGNTNQWISQWSQGIPDPRSLSGKAPSSQTSQLKSGTKIDALKDKNKPNPPSKGDSTTNKTPQGTAGQPPAGGRLQADQLTPEQLALVNQKARECVEVLACMDPRNIFPNEFPNFPMQQIPNYRLTAKQLLGKLGSVGGDQVASTLSSELMGVSPAQGLTPHNSYYQELLDLLGEAALTGNVTPAAMETLEQAAQGKKDTPQEKLAEEVLKIVEDSKSKDLPDLLARAADTSSQARKDLLYQHIRQQIPTASLKDLLVIANSKADRSLVDQAKKELEGRWKSADVVSLLDVMAQEKDAALATRAEAELNERSPRYADIKDQLPQVLEHFSSENKAVSAAAASQLANAFQRAPVSDVLQWMESEDLAFRQLVWQQMDGRIARADDDRKAGYEAAALEMLLNRDAKLPSRQAALELMQRLQRRQVVGQLIEVLPKLPRELWPQAGEVMRKLSGQNFGPNEQSGIAELTVELKKWRTWWNQSGVQNP